MFKNAKIVSGCVSPKDYHAENAPRGSKEYVVSSSALRVFADCPARFVAGYQPPDSESKTYGSLLDCRLLTPKDFPKRYAIKPKTYVNEDGETKEWNGNAKVCRQWVRDQGEREVISETELATCDAAIARLREDAVIAEFLFFSNTQVQLSGEWHDEKSGLVVPVKALLDMVPHVDSEFGKCLGDLKTTRNAAILPWQRWCYSAGYFIQAAFYTDLYVAATGEDRNTFCFILSENYPPYQTAKRMLSQDFLTLGRAEYRRLLENYCACLKRGEWPGYDDTDENNVQGWSVVEPEPFMAERAAFAPKFSIPETEPDAPESEEQSTEVIP